MIVSASLSNITIFDKGRLCMAHLILFYLYIIIIIIYSVMLSSNLD